MRAPDSASRAPRRIALLGVAAAALLAGLAWRGWRREPEVAGERLDEAFWLQRFARPEGGELALASLRGRPLVINCWATWCPPCVEEMPLLDRFQRERAAAGWQVLGLAVDRPEAVQAFLRQRPVGYLIGLAGPEGMALVRALGGAGGLPFTVVLAPNGSVLHRKMGKLTLQDLHAWTQ